VIVLSGAHLGKKTHQSKELRHKRKSLLKKKESCIKKGGKVGTSHGRLRGMSVSPTLLKAKAAGTKHGRKVGPKGPGGTKGNVQERRKKKKVPPLSPKKSYAGENSGLGIESGKKGLSGAGKGGRQDHTVRGKSNHSLWVGDEKSRIKVNLRKGRGRPQGRMRSSDVR